jgi:hypothetical protein
MFATCATPSPARKWYTRNDDDVEEDGYQRFVQRGVEGVDCGSSGDIEKKVIRAGSHMLATKARCNAISNERLVPRSLYQRGWNCCCIWRDGETLARVSGFTMAMALAWRVR